MVCYNGIGCAGAPHLPGNILMSDVGTLAVLAREVWGSDEAARAFLFRPHPMLEGRRPIDVVLANEFGRSLVEGILGRLQYGSAA